jgi:uncharacterized membrane protein
VIAPSGYKQNILDEKMTTWTLLLSVPILLSPPVSPPALYAFLSLNIMKYGRKVWSRLSLAWLIGPLIVTQYSSSNISQNTLYAFLLGL